MVLTTQCFYFDFLVYIGCILVLFRQVNEWQKIENVVKLKKKKIAKLLWEWKNSCTEALKKNMSVAHVYINL